MLSNRFQSDNRRFVPTHLFWIGLLGVAAFFLTNRTLTFSVVPVANWPVMATHILLSLLLSGYFLVSLLLYFYDHDWGTPANQRRLMIVAAALLCSGQDYGRSICLAVQAGFDTDCNGATVGSVLGMMLGEDGIPETWAAPVHGRLETDIFGVNEISLKEAAETTLKHLYLSK